MGIWRLAPGLFDRIQVNALQEFSIGMLHGTSLDALQPIRDGGTPVLSRSSVTDIPATFVADPFIHHFGGRWHMFFEIMHAAYRRGVIGLASSDDAVDWTYERVVLDEPFHLSYPYVFTFDGTPYMIPEAGRSGEVRLYRAAKYPYEWTLDRVLLEGAGYVDSSIFQRGDEWWLWTASPASGGLALRLFWADSPFGPWTEHPMSPVADHWSGTTRSAGRVIQVNGEILRFAQQAVPFYGTAVNRIRVDTLTKTRYAETLLPGSLLGPGEYDWNRDGMHHIDAQVLNDGRVFACVDGWRHGRI